MAVGSDSNMSGTQFCGLAERWNGTSWSLASGIDTKSPCPSGSSGAGSLTDVSCTSSRFCLAVGGPVAKRWNGSSWSAVRFPPGVAFATVSCRAVNGCAAGGATNTAYALGWWNGRSWATRIIADASGYDPQSEGPEMTGISCTWVKFCVAIGGDGANAPVAFQWNGRRWISRSNGALDTYHYGFPGPISCAATNACTAVDSNTGSGTYSYFFNGSRWSLSGTLPEANVSENTGDTATGSRAFRLGRAWQSALYPARARCTRQTASTNRSGLGATGRWRGSAACAEIRRGGHRSRGSHSREATSNGQRAPARSSFAPTASLPLPMCFASAPPA